MVPLKMKLGNAGEAFFVEETEVRQELNYVFTFQGIYIDIVGYLANRIASFIPVSKSDKI
jgi:hypothetical protein